MWNSIICNYSYVIIVRPVVVLYNIDFNKKNKEKQTNQNTNKQKTTTTKKQQHEIKFTEE